MLWKVRVKMEYESTRLKRRKIVPCIVGQDITVLVEADDSDQAFERGVAYAKDHAPFGPKWQSFDPREAVQFTLPQSI